MTETSTRTNLLGLGRDELERLAVESGRAAYRGRQLYHAIYGRRKRDFGAMTDLDGELRALLECRYEVAYPEILREFTSRDGSVRYLLGLSDGRTVESVYMPTEQGDTDRATLCISSQVGCAVDCKFCFTGLLGLGRNLTAGEIVGQVLTLVEVRSIPPKARLSVVFMGQGEPLLNLGPLMKAVSLLASTDGCGIALRRITVSTVGIVPRIYDLAREPVRPKLAISLNASNEEQRTALMPINRKYPLKDLMDACRAYPLRPRERLTFEYVMLDSINDSDADARRVAELCRGVPARVNLIPYNGGVQLPYRASPLRRVLHFQKVLGERGVPTFIRVSRGQDIMGACGQLSLAGSSRDLASTHPPGSVDLSRPARPIAPV
jgi:23S rRNA (adenine2503-C2)-methyltransferase